MKEFFTTEGRYNRLRYFLYSLILNVIMVIPQIMVNVADSLLPLLIALVMAIAGIYVSVCITVKRFHDLGRPGIHILLLLIPLYNIYLGLVLLFKKGEQGLNAYGDDPLAV